MHIGRREASYLPTTGSESPLLLYSNSRRFPIFQARNSRTKSPAFESRGPTDRPTNLPPPVRPPAHSPASVHRTVIFGQNRTVSYLNVSLAQSPSTGGRKPYARRFSTKAGLPPPPPPRLLSMEKWKPFLWISSLSLSISLSLFLGRGGSVIRTGRGQECCCAIFRWMYRIFNGRIGSIFYLRKNLSVSLSLSLARIISDDFDSIPSPSPKKERHATLGINSKDIYIYFEQKKEGK